jgi:hypothetical protein
MKIWVLLFVAFLFQEPISSAAVLINAYHLGYSVYLIHAIFIFSTTLDICIGYWVGGHIKNYAGRNKFINYLLAKVSLYKVSSHGKNISKLILFIFSPVAFPITAFLTPALGFTFLESLILLLVGEIVLWYGPLWLVVYGLHTFFAPYVWLITLMLIALLLISKLIRK